MKKTLVAFAALAAIGAAQAQSSVTLYGNLEASVYGGGKTVAGKSGVTAVDGAGLIDGTVWGLKGSEDLGGGLKAGFGLEGGLDIASGTNQVNGGTATVGALFNREANVSLSGGFGSVKAGVQISPFILAAAGGFADFNISTVVPALVSAGVGAAAPAGLGGSSPTAGFFIPNAVSYSTPTVGGFNASVLTSQDGNSADTYSTGIVNYVNGPLALHAGYATAGRDNALGVSYTASTVTGTYNIQSLTIGAGWFQTKSNGTTTSVTEVSAAYKVSPATTVSATYWQNDAAVKASQAQFLAHYALSKSTSLFAMVADGKNVAPLAVAYDGPGSSEVAPASGTAYAIGIRKGF
jgi:predicted porin